MLSAKKTGQRACRYLFLLLIVVTPFSFAMVDRIDTPSPISYRASDGLLLDVTKAGERLIAVGDQGRVLISEDQGKQWRQVQSPVSVLLTAVFFSDAQHGWAVGHDGVLIHTKDAGETWVKQLDGRQLNQLQLKTYQALVDAGGDPQAQDLLVDELEFYLEDAVLAEEEGPTQPLLDVFFINNQQGFLLGSYGSFLKTEDGGEHWSVLSHRLPNPDRFHLNALSLVQQVGRPVLIIGGEAGLLFRSNDLGDSWVALGSPYEGSFFGLSSFEQQGQSQLLALGLRGHLFASDNTGDSWQQVELHTSSSLTSAAVYGNELMLVGLGGLVLHASTNDDLQGSFKFFEQHDRRAWSSVVRVDDGWVLVGEKGIKRVSDKALEASYE
ncbi:WD40/YVTN/BNR-like repeat-containing protein [Neptunomonas japonica]|uniref:WD40/YVTN/BNR-like repeat-containing protein n=1 Tax=Neptunomonas japonica TaxID=417574 RepID=UPI00040048C8|nr:YCF48-related protein [Neptunomonas japonica]